MAFRVFSVLAALLLVSAVALGTLVPPETTLAQGLAQLDPGAYQHGQRALQAALGASVWRAVLAPLLVRPVWLLPAMLGLVCVGCAVTALGPAAGQKKHRRS